MTISLSKHLVVLVLLLLAGCGNLSLGDSRIDGTVLDGSTDKPIPGAIVIVQWSGDIHGIVQGSSICYHTEAALTDVNGKFMIPAWHRTNLNPGEKNVTDKKRHITVYMEGFTNRGSVPMMDRSGSIRIERATATGEKRLQDIGIGVSYGCNRQDGSNAQLDPFVERVCAEEAELLKQMGRPVKQCMRVLSTYK